MAGNGSPPTYSDKSDEGFKCYTGYIYIWRHRKIFILLNDGCSNERICKLGQPTKRIKDVCNILLWQYWLGNLFDRKEEEESKLIGRTLHQSRNRQKKIRRSTLVVDGRIEARLEFACNKWNTIIASDVIISELNQQQFGLSFKPKKSGRKTDYLKVSKLVQKTSG